MSWNSVVGVAIIFACLAICSVMGDPTQAPGVKKPLSCYKCDNCVEPFNMTTPKPTKETCGPTIDSCFKFHHSDKKVQRGCSPSVDDDCPDDNGGKFNLAYCYTCYASDCNSGRRVQELSVLSLITASVASVLGLFMWKNNC